jgi:hypothetical protein
MNKNQLVISRYGENLDWLMKWRDEFDIIVYNKGEKIDNNNYTVVELPNYGRESQTYLHHIVENYDSLYDGTIFLQGDIKDIGINVFKNLMQYVVEIENNGFSASNIGFFNETLWNDIDFLSDPRYKSQVESGFLKLSEIKFKDYVQNHFNKIPQITPVCWCGCFGVRKDFILSRTKDFYQRLLESFPNHHNPEEAHFLERMWAYIFTENNWNY